LMRGTARKGTLLWLLDRTRTPMGGRMLREWILRPLTDAQPLRERHDAVESLLDVHLREPLREGLRAVADLERLASKVALETANARDLVALATSLSALPHVAQSLTTIDALRHRIPRDTVADVAAEITHWLVEEPPTATTEGGLVRSGVHAELDELVVLSREGKGAMARMEARERENTGISSLKIKHNRVFGYFLEVTHANVHLVPADWIRKQTLTNAERYITAELKEFEEKVLGADERRKQLEYALFRDLRARVGEHVERIQACARAIAWLDVVATFAELAEDRRYVRPQLEADPAVLEIEGGRHPVVEAMDLETPFVPNDLVLTEGARLIILTGPNMAGKSTVMRQVALIALMAQIGSFVPADRARLGICDRIFVRVGASDDLARGRSTFMVEMSETAHILNHATEQSLILLDEIGRGTSTYDGLAIAWAVAEAVADTVSARTIFATHYHELVALAQDRTTVANRHVAVSEHGERIIFLHALREGGASRSYGIQCARIAGMPRGVVRRARDLLAELERRPKYGPPTRQLSLFNAAPEPEAPQPPPPGESDSALRAALEKYDPDDLTPRQAHAALYALHELLGGKKPKRGRRA
jgi:DNA mismatch repair protein MutS